jgi:hypothetical protein
MELTKRFHFNEKGSLTKSKSNAEEKKVGVRSLRSFTRMKGIINIEAKIIPVATVSTSLFAIFPPNTI